MSFTTSDDIAERNAKRMLAQATREHRMVRESERCAAFDCMTDIEPDAEWPHGWRFVEA